MIERLKSIMKYYTPSIEDIKVGYKKENFSEEEYKGKIFPYYLTEFHRDSKSTGWIRYTELKAMINLFNKLKEDQDIALWGLKSINI